MNFQELLQSYNLKATKPRLLVLQALQKINKPVLHQEIHNWIIDQGKKINLVTIYRILETFQQLHIIHPLPHGNGFALCSLQNKDGHHILLCCEQCGAFTEEVDTELCKQENKIAARAGFTSTHHINQIVGRCHACS